MEETLATEAGLPFRAIDSGQLRGMAPWVAARSLWRSRRGAQQAATILQEFRPDVTLVTGGFVAAPVVWASWRARVPVLIYLPDVEPGLAIRYLSRLAHRVAVSFPEVADYFPGKALVTGYPVRRSFLAAAGQRTAARESLGLAPDDRVVLVFGGSRGARSINQALATALPLLLPACQVVHITGTLDWPDAQQRAQDLPDQQRHRYRAFPYLHQEMAPAMAAADLAVARAGASTLGEFPIMGLPSILVPYPYSGQHQDANADYLVARGAALKVADHDLANNLAPMVLRLLDQPDALAGMRQAARSLASWDAAAAIAEACRQLAGTIEPHGH